MTAFSDKVATIIECWKVPGASIDNFLKSGWDKSASSISLNTVKILNVLSKYGNNAIANIPENKPETNNLIVFKATPKLSSIEKKLKIKYNKIFIIANCIPIAITEERVPIFLLKNPVAKIAIDCIVKYFKS